ncbi:hypothetical protein [Aureimonas psammosilenae]|uniref:hypothetical protein n=1 Tax=Aureimonas psammosilenae TaxID=2495496 RepID=UPI001260769C|nr:hypothetical protein [Aureimonas psammosilenae]
MSGENDLLRLVSAELSVPVVSEAVRFADKLAGEARRPPVAILFYGSSLRTGDLDGLLDFYVLVDRLTDWTHGRWAAGANRLLPPNVEYHEATLDGRVLRAKVAILSLNQFRRLARPQSLDNSVWARFSQPVACVYARDEAAREAAVGAVAGAVRAAVVWSVRLGAREGTPADYWRGLFRRTYASELRVEAEARPDDIVSRAPERYERMFLAAAKAEGLAWENAGEGRIRLVDDAPRGAQAAWARRRRLGKPLNFVRLLKAAFTFRNGADYLVWKIQRHTGIAIPLTERQRRFPLLASVPIIRRLWQRKRASG